ncbi:Cof subfamily protein (haloacid dehalogenase superfamily) [Breznakia sp. PF5-3]|uniref:HAD family hydrolase n=1 Tax=unclassified Breznakia TaxID=2623764 RepID=UPI0024061256|nr:MULTISPECIES: HAD family hydrolase [unclassified Breznakia]MDF9823819.1 Cof subfamily protein (haloacid dehalogenase superfamily) [Breznakia sp. PM6-1]MDF9834615.1 Cof subfamily protein (haloacid dehalogenase superfamily) [Breznakia sp. PF5-3]MDF9836768.1 Cof subfamily protein (haloacid dehalogenase superfamily) [Breznakia sp. PFB2-8]MDF9858783.1 Cof subfamily protein (haloacid dehalogenase superfamily) [Breznakia sp. PH5-24]
MIKLAVFDVDGTLIPEGKREPSKRIIETLHALQKNGIKIAIASGRPPFFIHGDLNTYAKFDYYVCVNGAYVADSEFHEVYRNPMDLKDVESLIKDFMAYDDALMFQFDDAAYGYHGNKRITSMISKWIGRLDVLVDERNTKSRHLKSLPFGGVCQINPNHIEEYRKKYPHLAFDSFSEEHYDIHAKDYSKADGVKKICEELGLSADEVIAFGDNYNDLQMLEFVGTGVAMGNAKPEVKTNSDYVTETSEDDGVYHACKHFDLI